MDETQALLRAVITRLEEMGAELKGLRTEVKEFRADTNERLEKVEERLAPCRAPAGYSVRWVGTDR
jgi:hypothetical protein